MENNVEYTDRYQALGMTEPDVDTMCKGQCEGIGTYPVRRDDTNLTSAERNAIKDIINADGQESDDGWYFIPCDECDGTGTRR